MGAKVLSDHKLTERASTFRVHHPFRYPLAVKLGHLRNQVMVLQQDPTTDSLGQGMLIALNRYPSIVGRVTANRG